MCHAAQLMHRLISMVVREGLVSLLRFEFQCDRLVVLVALGMA